MDPTKATKGLTKEIIDYFRMPEQICFDFIHDRFEWALAIGYEIGRAQNQSVFKKPVVQMDRAGIILNIYPSMRDAAKKADVRISAISEVCREKRKTAGGFKWEFLNSKDFYKGRHLDKPKKKNDRH